MKSINNKYLYYIKFVLLFLIFCIAFYYLVINIFHSTSLNKKVYTSSSDNYYRKYQLNIDAINANLKNYTYKNNKYAYDNNTMHSINNRLAVCYNALNSQKGLFGIRNENITYYDVYELNNNFINSLIDKCFHSNLLWITSSKDSKLKEEILSKQNMINTLANNSSYIKDELKGNSSYSYRTTYLQRNVRNDLESTYQFVLHNYYDFSQIILDFSNYLVEGE